MLQPNKTKFKKTFKPKVHGRTTKRGAFVNEGYGLKAMSPALIGSRALEAARKAMSRPLKKIKGDLMFRIFPDMPFTRKPSETRMGSGKGSVEGYVARVEPGRIMFEVRNVSHKDALRVFALGAVKLGVKTKVVEPMRGNS